MNKTKKAYGYCGCLRCSPNDSLALEHNSKRILYCKSRRIIIGIGFPLVLQYE